MAKKNKKKGMQLDVNKHQYNMKVVHSGICEACKMQCARGISYMDQMSKPGAVGYGVPCILTKGKAYK
jgi:hypothetical protein